MLSEAEGLPPVVGVRAAGTADTAGIPVFKPLLLAIPPIRSRRGPRRRRPGKARAGKARTPPACGNGCAGAVSSRASPAVASSPAGACGTAPVCAIECTIAWLLCYRRLGVGRERHGHLFAAFLTLAAALIRFKKRTHITT
ncbi:hypothetical protein Acsp03_58700 [Actinomadura sp. NBRC 104412]|nr:hypothetical protein Acsp03_58700 [Actinomadura sp. NBRC 104412]